MANVSRSTLRGLLLMDPRLSAASLWAAQSTYTQADPRAGLYAPQVATALVLAPTGTQTAGTQIQVKTIDPGLGLDGSFAWRLSTDTLYQGWETPITISGWEAWTWDDGTVAAGERAAIKPHAVTLADGTICGVAQVEWRNPVGPVTTYQVRCYRRNAATGAVTSYLVREVASVTDGLYPCLLLRPTGRLLCFSWLEAGTTAQLYVSVSDDGGLTWSAATRHGLRVPIDTSGAPGAGAAGYALNRIRAVEGRGGVMLLLGLVANNTTAGTIRDQCWQYNSIDEGNNFTLVTAINTDARGSVWFDLIWTGSAFLFGFLPVITGNPGTTYFYSIRAPTADSPLNQWPIDSHTTLGVFATCSTFGAGNWHYDDGDISLVKSEDGAIYFLSHEVFSSVCVYSPDDGRTFSRIGWSVGSTTPWFRAAASTYIKDLAATWQHGRIAVLHNWAANPGNEDNSLGCAYLGGYSSLTQKNYYGAAGTWYDACGWTTTWLPFDLPGDCGWTRTAAGGTETLAVGGLQLDSAAGTIYYHEQPVGTVAEGLQAELHVTMGAGGSVNNEDVALKLELGDGAALYTVTARLSAGGGFRIYDDQGTATLVLVVAVLTSIHIRLSIAGGLCSCWYRIPTKEGDEKRTWVKVVDAAAIVDGGAGPAVNTITWGHIAGGAATSTWTQVCWVSDEWAGGTLASGQSNPADIQGRLYSVLPEYIAEGVSIAATSGPTMVGDVAYISTAYGYPIESIFPEVRPSPREGWRSLDDSAQATIAVRLDPTFVADCGPGNDIIGLGLWATNIRTCALQGYSGAWSTLLTLTTDSGLSGLHFTRTGNTVQSDGTTAGPYIHFDEFAGGSFVFDDGTIRRIASNTEGSLGTGTKRATLILEDVLNTEPAAGTAGAVRSTFVVGLVKLNGADYSAYRLLIAAQDTVDGDFRIGTLLLGPVAVFGFDPSWGRSTQTTPNREESEASDWTRTVRSRAPARRTVDISWTDGVDTSGAYSGDPDYLLDMAAGVAVASHRDTPFQVEGLVRSLAGPGKLVAYLPAIPYAGSTVTLNRRWQGMLGEVISPITVDTVQGEEGSTEVVRVPTLSIREVV